MCSCPVLCCPPSKLTRKKKKKKPNWKRKLYFCYWLKRVPSITWLLLKSGNPLNPGRFVFPHIWNERREENTSVEAEGLFLDPLLFWVSVLRNFPWGGGRSCVCTMLDGFPYSALYVPQSPASQHITCHAHQLSSESKPCASPASCVGHPCVEHVWRSEG